MGTHDEHQRSSEHLGRPEISAGAQLQLNELMNLSFSSLPTSVTKKCISSFSSLAGSSSHASLSNSRSTLPPDGLCRLSASLGSLSITGSQSTLPPGDTLSSSHASLSTTRSTLPPRDTSSHMGISSHRVNTVPSTGILPPRDMLSHMDISSHRANTVPSTDILPPTDISFVSLGSLLKEDSTCSHVEHNSDAKDEHSSHAKNRDDFHVDDFVSSVWNRDDSGTISGDLTSKQPRQPIIQNKKSFPGDVDPSKRFFSQLIGKRAGTPYSKQRAPPTSKRVKREKKRELTMWSKEEDRRLQEGVEIYGLPNWVAIAKYVGTRNNKKCRQRWFMSVNPEIRETKKGKWSAEEDEQLRQIVFRHGSKDARTWQLASKGMRCRRNIKQCRERWENFLDPSLRLGPWTKEEDELLLRLHGKFGNAWTKIASILIGRSAERVRRRVMQLRKKTGSKR